MDEYLAFFNKPLKRINVGDTCTNEMRARAARETTPPRLPISSRFAGCDYATEELKLNSEREREREREDPLEDEEDDDDDGGYPSDDNEPAQRTAEVFEKYNFCKDDTSQTLPIVSYKETILHAIESQSVTIVEGPTGCGKSTQIPYWLLEDAYKNGQHCNIIVTQPRRIAAISIAKRVCQETETVVGDLIGYQVSFIKKTSEDTRLQYVTTRILLNDLVSSRSLKKYTHIILDEVHERENEMDFLLVVIKKLLPKSLGKVKIILMSATFNAFLFSDYFATKIDNKPEAVPIISIPESRQFKLQIYHLNELTKIGQLPNPVSDKPAISRAAYEFALKLLNNFEKIDQQSDQNDRCSVLIFLPGYNEIEELFVMLDNEETRKKIDPYSPIFKWWLVPLHSTITAEEQNNVFKKPPPDCRKIILSTNIAESSITVPDVKYVIDFCLTKVIVYNPNTNFSSLQLSWAAKTNCIQRAGRAGRVSNGRVFRLVTQEFYEMLPDDPIPEIKRCPLENVILLVKRMDMGSPKSMLALAIDPPDLSNIYSTILTLKEVGAMYRTVNGKISYDDGDLTALGEIMSTLPLDIKITKLILLGYIFGCVHDAIIIGASLNVRNIFNTPFLQKMDAYNSKLTWSFGSTSDCIALLNVYKVYKQLESEKFRAFGGKPANWAKTMFLQLNSVKEVDYLVNDIKLKLTSQGFNLSKETTCIWTNVQLPLVLKMIIAGAFYPNYYSLMSKTEIQEREAAKDLNGRDPFNTVYFRNMDNQQPGILYASQVRKFFKCTELDNLDINFDPNSSKIFVSSQNVSEPKFASRAKIPGNASLFVYQAVKMRTLKYPFVLNVMPREKALERAENLKLINVDKTAMQTINKMQQESYPVLPGIDESHVMIKICHIENCSIFWAHNDDTVTERNLFFLNDSLNGKSNLLVHLKRPPVLGSLYAAPFQCDDGSSLYYRARIEKIWDKDHVLVYFIDYGNKSKILTKSLRELQLSKLYQIRPLAFRCTLSELSPSLIKNPSGFWTAGANNRFRELVSGKTLFGKIYSVYNSIVSLELMANNLNINEVLLEEGYAQMSEESYASKVNHDLRERINDMNPTLINIHNEKQVQNEQIISYNFMPPQGEECTQKIILKGPFSPLETSVRSLVYHGKCRNAAVDWDSVNSVILLNDFQPSCGRLLVAAFVNESSDGDSLNLRNTTLMPNMPGLTEIITLTFCPTAELFVNEYGDHYTSFLAGLGHENGESIYPEHDLYIETNVAFTNEDIENINFLRKTLDFALTNINDSGNDSNHINCPLAIKTVIEKLISHSRKTVDLVGCPEPVWGQMDSGFENGPSPSFKKDHKHPIFPPHKAIKLIPKNQEMLIERARENAELHNICKGLYTNDKQFYTCTLCNSGLMNVPSLRLHMFSRMHKDNEAELSVVEE